MIARSKSQQAVQGTGVQQIPPQALGQDPEVRVIVIRAEGRGFCAGVDIKELDAHPELIVKVNAARAPRSISACPTKTATRTWAR